MRAVVGLVLLVAVALVGAGILAGSEQVGTALQAAGLSRFLPTVGEPRTPVADAPAQDTPAQAAPPSRYTPFRTVAVSEPSVETATVATGAAPAVSSSLVGRSEIAPPVNSSASAPGGTPQQFEGAEKRGRFKIACSAGQRLDRAKHKCVSLKHAAHGKKKNG